MNRKIRRPLLSYIVEGAPEDFEGKMRWFQVVLFLAVVIGAPTIMFFIADALQRATGRVPDHAADFRLFASWIALMAAFTIVKSLVGSRMKHKKGNRNSPPNQIQQ